MDIPDAFRLSKWVHEREKNGIIALYHALNIDLVFIDADLGKILHLLRFGTTIKCINSQHPDLVNDILPALQELLHRNFLINVRDDDEILFTNKQVQALYPAGLETLYLMLTDSCNLKCSYCFVLNGMPINYRHNSMSFETAKRAVDIYFANIAKNPTEYNSSRKIINFYGGEPLIEYQLIKKIVEYVNSTYFNEIQSLDDKFIFSLITNGTLIDQEVASYFASHPRIALTVSLDGAEWINDKKRVAQTGKGTFTNVMRGLRYLRTAGCKNISLSCTIDSHNIDHLDELLAFQEEFNFLSINLNPLLDTEKDKVGVDYIEKISDRLLSYFKKAREYGVYEDRIMRKVRPFLSQRIHTHDCQATGHQIVCSPDGNIGMCQEGIGMKNYFFANASSDFNFHEHPIVKEWNDRTPLKMPQCKHCAAIGICGGGCAYGAQLRNGSIWSVDDRFCIHSRTSLDWLIWDIYAHSSTSFPSRA